MVESTDNVKATVSKLLECPICLELLQDPKTLSCSHSFCKSCLANILKSRCIRKDDTLIAPVHPIHIDCPICKATSKPFQSLEEIDTSPIINLLLEAHNKDQGVTCKSASLPCACGKAAKYLCYRCRNTYCPSCYKQQKGKRCKVEDNGVSCFMNCIMKHVFINIQSQEDIYLCKDHSVPLDFFCIDCIEVVCITCFLIGHNLHIATPIHFARREVLESIDMIQSIKCDAASKCAQLHQDAAAIMTSVEVNEQGFHDQLEDQEKKVHGLISSLFKDAKSYYCNKIGQMKGMAKEILSLHDKSAINESIYDFSSMNDFELACLMTELTTVMEKRREEALDIEGKIKMLRKLKSPNILRVWVDEASIFKTIIGIVDQFHLKSKPSFKFSPHDFNFQDYSKGKYSYAIEQQRAGKVTNSPVAKTSERISYSRDFLLKLRSLGERPILLDKFLDLHPCQTNET